MRLNFGWNKTDRDIEQIEWKKSNNKKDHLQNKLKQMCLEHFFPFLGHYITRKNKKEQLM